MIVSALIKAAMRIAQVIRKGEDPDAQELTDAQEALEIMLHSWSARRLLVRANVPETFPLAPNIASYTIGVGGVFSTSKPYKIATAFVRDSNNVDTPLDIVGMEYYQGLSDKALSVGRPEMLVYDAGNAQQSPQLGTIVLYSIPDAVYTLGILSQKPFTDFASLTEDVTFDLPYEEAIKYELAIRLWPEYHSTPIPVDIHMMANEAMHVVESMNAISVACGTDLPGTKNMTPYNIYTGEYSN